MRDRATEVALFRYALIREAADPALTTRQRGRLVREAPQGLETVRCHGHSTSPMGQRPGQRRVSLFLRFHH